MCQFATDKKLSGKKFLSNEPCLVPDFFYAKNSKQSNMQISLLERGYFNPYL